MSLQTKENMLEVTLAKFQDTKSIFKNHLKFSLTKMTKPKRKIILLVISSKLVKSSRIN